MKRSTAIALTQRALVTADPAYTAKFADAVGSNFKAAATSIASGDDEKAYKHIETGLKNLKSVLAFMAAGAGTDTGTSEPKSVAHLNKAQQLLGK